VIIWILQQNRLQWYGHVLQKEDTIGVSALMFLLVPAQADCPRQNPESHKTVACMCVCLLYYMLLSRCVVFKLVFQWIYSCDIAAF